MQRRNNGIPHSLHFLEWQDSPSTSVHPSPYHPRGRKLKLTVSLVNPRSTRYDTIHSHTVNNTLVTQSGILIHHDAPTHRCRSDPTTTIHSHTHCHSIVNTVESTSKKGSVCDCERISLDQHARVSVCVLAMRLILAASRSMLWITTVWAGARRSAVQVSKGESGRWRKALEVVGTFSCMEIPFVCAHCSIVPVSL
jgi:hypothetical protein